MAKQIGDILVEKGVVTPEELQRALAEQEKTGEFLGSALIRMGCISEEQLLQSLSEQLNIPFANLKHLTIDRAVIQRVPARLVEHYKVMPIRWERDVLTIALSNLHRYTWALEDIGLRSEEHTSELQSLAYLVCRLLLEKKKNIHIINRLY